MPLYIDNSEILATYPQSIANALLRIKQQMEGKSVNPKLAVRLLRQELHPLIDVEHHDILNELINPTWADINWAYPAMVFRGGPDGHFLHLIAKCILTVCERTTNPPRDAIVFERVEVRDFFEMNKFRGRDISHLRYVGKDNFDVLRSCKYCWRQPMPRKMICTSHAGGDKFKEINIGTTNPNENGRSDSALRKEAYRQEELFNKLLVRKLSDEVWEFHESGFEAEVLIPQVHIWDWLKKNREEVARLLLDENLPTTDEHIIDSLIKALHSPTNLGAIYEEPFTRANQAIRNEPQLIWPMLLRANSWLAARKQLRVNWGGNRMPDKPKSLRNNLIGSVTQAIKSVFGK